MNAERQVNEVALENIGEISCNVSNESLVALIPSARVRALRQTWRSATSPRVYPQTLKGSDLTKHSIPKYYHKGYVLTTTCLQEPHGALCMPSETS